MGKLEAIIKRLPGWIVFILLSSPLPVWATQQHGDPEGLSIYQVAHVFFAFSMGLLIYWLRKRLLVREKGWRYIQYAAVFFIAWTADAFLIQWMDEQTRLIQTLRIGATQIHLTSPQGYEWLVPLYYVARLDHLLCVPALMFLFTGLRRLLKDQAAAASGKTTA